MGSRMKGYRPMKAAIAGGLAGVLVWGALGSCAGLGQGEEPLIVGAEDDGGRVELRMGRTLEIQLEGNPSTGYRWEAGGYGKEILEMGELRSEPAESGAETGDEPGTVTGGETEAETEAETEVEAEAGFVGSEMKAGAPRMTVFSFKAVGCGKTEVRLVYRQPWEDEPPEERFTLTVQVTE